MIDTSVAHAARVWNYWLGGKDNYPIDHEFSESVREVMPGIIDIVRADRGFLVRAVRYLAAEVGIRQFLDIGTGLPTVNNTHEVAQSIAPQCRIVYADNDPLVLVHARALLTRHPAGVTDYLDADLRDPEKIVRQAARTLDFTQPIGLMLLGVVNFILDADEAQAVVNRLLDALPAGSYLLLSHPSAEVHRGVMLKYLRLWNENATPRSRSAAASRSVASSTSWSCWSLASSPVRCGGLTPATSAHRSRVDMFCGVGRKPVPL